MQDITTLIKTTDVSGYLYSVETKEEWISFRDPRFALNSTSQLEQRFNESGQVAYYLASGEATAQRNVHGWEAKTKCRAAPQTLNCFDLPSFAKDHGIYHEYLKSKEEGGYPLPQATADVLLKDYGITGILYTSYPDYLSGADGLCIVIRPQDNKFVGENFFVTGDKKS